MAEKDNKFEVSTDFRNTTLGDFDGIFPPFVDEGEDSEVEFKERLFEHNSRGEKYYDTILSKLKAHAPEIPLALMYSLFDTESSFKPNAVSNAKNKPTPALEKLGYTSENMGDHGAKGLGQFMNVASGYQIAQKFEGTPGAGRTVAPDKLFGNTLHDPFDTDQNIEASIKKLKRLIKKFGVSGGLHAYNAGAGRHSRKKDKDISTWANPNYSEKILSNFQKFQGISEAPKEEKASDIVINIGDSNGIRKGKFSKGLNRSVGSATMRHWNEALDIYFKGETGEVSVGKSKIKIPFEDKSGNPIPVSVVLGDQGSINVSVIGGNDIAGRGEVALSDSYIDAHARPLMEMIKATGGTFGGPAPVSDKVTLSDEMGGDKQMPLRIKLNDKLKVLAGDVGITYVDNIEELLSKYDGENPDSLYEKDGVHVKEEEFKGSSEGKEDEELKQPEKREKARSEVQTRRYRGSHDIRHLSDEAGISVDNIKFLSAALKKDLDFRKLLNGLVFLPLENESRYFEVPTEMLDNANKKGLDISSPIEISNKERSQIFQRLRSFGRSSGSDRDIAKLLPNGIQGVKAYSLLSHISKNWVSGSLEKDLKDYKKQFEFIQGKRFEENKGNNQMRITKERLAQIIKEEVEAYKASQLNEVDVDELKDAEAYIKEIADLLKSTYETFFKGAAPAIGTPQTKADTGEPVTDQTAHEDAKGLLLDLLGDAIDEFQEKDTQHEQQLDEDGHDDVPSAVRAMKTMAEDALEMLDALEQMDGSLPTWWTNKMAVSASMLNKMRDYLLVPSMEEEMDEQ